MACTAWPGCGSRHPRSQGNRLGAGTIGGFGQQSIARFKVRVKAPVRQSSLFHDVGHAGTVIPAATNGARRHLHDTLVGEFLAADRRALAGFGRHDGHHIRFQLDVHAAHAARRRQQRPWFGCQKFKLRKRWPARINPRHASVNGNRYGRSRPSIHKFECTIVAPVFLSRTVTLRAPSGRPSAYKGTTRAQSSVPVSSTH